MDDINEKILIVDDEKEMRDSLSRVLKSEGYGVLCAVDSNEALSLARENEFSLAIIDLSLPGINGLELFKKIKDIRSDTMGIMITGYGTMESAVEAMEIGIYDFITKPFSDIDRIISVTNKAVLLRRLSVDNRNLIGELNRSKDYLCNILKTMSDALMVVSGDKKIKMVNEAMSNLTCYREDELVGRAADFVFAKSDFFNESRMVQLSQGKIIREHNVSFLLKSGLEIPVILTASALRDTEGVLTDIVSTARDIREIELLFGRESELVAMSAQAETQKNKSTKLEKKIEERTAEISVLYEVSNAMAYTLDHQQLLTIIMEALYKIVKYDICSSVIFDSHTANLAVKPACPEYVKFAEQAKKILVDALFSESGHSVYNDDVTFTMLEACTESNDCDSSRDAINTSINIPFVVRGKIIGMMNFSSVRESAFSEEEVKLATTVVNQASHAIERLQSVMLAQKSKMDSMVESMAEGVIMTDERGEIAVLNPKARQMLGFGPDTDVSIGLLMRKMISLKLDKDLGTCEKEKKAVSKEVVVKNKDKELILNCDISPVMDENGNVLGVLSIFRDITQEKQVERMKNDFISAVSHELRTPLTSIRESVAQVYEGILGQINEKQGVFLELCIRNIDRLTRIINNLLDMSRVEAGKVKIQKECSDIIKLAQYTIDTFRPQAETKGLRIESNYSSESILGYVDKDKTTQVFVNLINNAMKFTDKGSITVSVRLKGDVIECSVSDTGRGISKEDLPKVFNKFQQFGRDAGPEEKGTGLGLAISKGIIEAQGGKISVDSQPGAGTVFIFVLDKFSMDSEICSVMDKEIEKARLRSDKLFLFIVRVNDYEKVKRIIGIEEFKEIRNYIIDALKKIVSSPDKVFARGEEEIVIMGALNSRYGTEINQKMINNVLNEAIFEVADEKDLDFLYGYSIFPFNAKDSTSLIAKAQESLISEKDKKVKRRIVIVDDEPSVVASVQKILESAGYKNCNGACNGEEALIKVEEQPCDLIILDMEMPKMNGYEVIGRLKSKAKTKDIPVLVMSGYAVDSDRLGGYTLERIIPIIPKPIDIHLFLRLVNFLL
ncbi:MAG: response regulator [Candidatus Omnitrophota bacterium]